MIELTNIDFQPLVDFALLKRWTPPTKDALPEKTLAQFQPLTHTKATELWNETARYRNELWDYAFKNIPDPLPDISSFTSIIHIDANREGIEKTTEQLLSFDLPRNDPILVMWEPAVAMRISWGLFCDSWPDLCFPSSDDVSICPTSEAWFLQYHHEDQFIFGKIRADLPDLLKEELPVVSNKVLMHQDELLRLLQANEKIAAIKLYQKETGIPFKAAIEAIEKIVREMRS